jgi:hypothetical protein
LFPGIGQQCDRRVDDGEDERQPRDRCQELDVAQPLADSKLENRETENQPAGK